MDVVIVVGGGVCEGGGVAFELFVSLLQALLLLLQLSSLLSLLLSKTASAASAHVGSGGSVGALMAGAGHNCASGACIVLPLAMASAASAVMIGVSVHNMPHAPLDGVAVNCVAVATVGHNCLSLIAVAEEMLLARALVCRKRAASFAEP